MNDPYVIYSTEHGGWRRPNWRGYTRFLGEAGRYSWREALVICRRARGGFLQGDPPPEIPVLLADMLQVEARDPEHGS